MLGEWGNYPGWYIQKYSGKHKLNVSGSLNYLSKDASKPSLVNTNKTQNNSWLG